MIWEQSDSLQKYLLCSCASAAATFLFVDHHPSIWFLPALPLLSCLFLPHLPIVGLGPDRTLQEGKKESLLPSMCNGRSFLTYFIPYYFDILKLKQDHLTLGPAEQHLLLIAGHCTAPAVLPHSLCSVAVLGLHWKQLRFQAAHSTDGPLRKLHTAMKIKEMMMMTTKSLSHTEWKAAEIDYIFLQQNKAKAPEFFALLKTLKSNIAALPSPTLSNCNIFT